MSYCCPTPNAAAMSPSLDVGIRVVPCGTLTGNCGSGIQRVYFYLGTIQSDVTVWFTRKYAEDSMTVYQFGESIASAPDGSLDGSFTFSFAPYDEIDGMDAVYIDTTSRHNDSAWEFKITCPEEINDKVIVNELQETSIRCGRSHHQSGYVKKNTILLGDEAGEVSVAWSVQGYATVSFYQGSNLIETIKSNRSGEFSFYFDPADGDVYAITEGIGTVDYIFSCPYVDATENVERFEFTCGSGAYSFEAPNVAYVNITDTAGAVQVRFTTESTVVLNFYQGDFLIYTVQQFEGSAEFSFDYDPANGTVRIESSNYGNFSLELECPYVEPELVDETPTEYGLDCWDTVMQQFTVPSNISVSFPAEDGQVTVDFEILGSSQLTFTYNGVVINNGYSNDGLRSFTFDHIPGNLLYITAIGTDPFSLMVGCPTPPPPQEYNASCGSSSTFDGPANITLALGSLNGNFQITSNNEASLYKNDALHATINSTTQNFFYTVGDVWEVSYSGESLTLTSVCPSIKNMDCSTEATFLAGDTINLNASTSGETVISVASDAGVFLSWYVDGDLVSAETNGDVALSFTSQSTVQVLSSGSGEFILNFPCPT